MRNRPRMRTQAHANRLRRPQKPKAKSLSIPNWPADELQGLTPNRISFERAVHAHVSDEVPPPPSRARTSCPSNPNFEPGSKSRRKSICLYLNLSKWRKQPENENALEYGMTSNTPEPHRLSGITVLKNSRRLFDRKIPGMGGSQPRVRGFGGVLPGSARCSKMGVVS